MKFEWIFGFNDICRGACIVPINKIYHGLKWDQYFKKYNFIIWHILIVICKKFEVLIYYLPQDFKWFGVWIWLSAIFSVSSIIVGLLNHLIVDSS